jgi:serine/threonine protein kinase
VSAVSTVLSCVVFGLVDNIMATAGQSPKPQIQPCRYKTGKTLGAGSYSVVKECVHIDTGRYYAAKVINKRMMAGREHMVNEQTSHRRETIVSNRLTTGTE